MQEVLKNWMNKKKGDYFEKRILKSTLLPRITKESVVKFLESAGKSRVIK